MKWCCDCKNKYTKCDNCKNMSNFEKGDATVELLEDIKAEFEDIILLNQTVAIQIIDKRISDLKGE